MVKYSLHTVIVKELLLFPVEMKRRLGGQSSVAAQCRSGLYE